MKYAIDFLNMRTALHGLLLFKSKKIANKAYQDLYYAEHGTDSNETYDLIVEKTLKNCHSTIDEIDRCFIKDTIKNREYSINEDGHVHPEYDNIRIVNYGYPLDLYCL